jgi:aerobic carbon-monoxide dehydrogenase small subunit
LRRVALTVNGERHELELEPRELLVYLLRERLGLTGTSVGCETSSCGACTVLVNGESVKSCTMLGVQADGFDITTIEGLATNGKLHVVQQAFHDHHALQCGYCTPGMVMASHALLRDHPHPTEEEIRKALGGNLCMCTGYVQIVEAVKDAAKGSTNV